MKHPGQQAAARPRVGLLLAVSLAAVLVATVVLIRAVTGQPESPQVDVSAKAAAAPKTAPKTAPTAGTSKTPEQPAKDDPPPGKPSVLTLPDLDVQMAIKAVGVSDNGEMVMPSRPTTIGWYRFGPAPGSKTGAVVLAGHVDSKEYGIGPLAKLRASKVGQTVVIRDENGRKQSYVVQKTEEISKQTIALERIFTRSGPPLLHILTCGGAYLADQGGYQDNVVVTAVAL